MGKSGKPGEVCERIGIGYTYFARCPDYLPRKTWQYCIVCGDGIYEGEEYIENGDGECMHLDCVRGVRELLDWLDCQIKVKGDDDYGQDIWED